MTPGLPPSLRRLLPAALAAALLPVSAAPPGSPDNSSAGRETLRREILPDLRVFLDMAPGQMPWNRIEGELSREEVREAAALGIGNWASVLSGMRFRFVDSPGRANLVIRFRDYRDHIPGGATAVAFLPGEWRPASPPGRAPDFSCGAEAFGRLPSGEPCRETGHNMILFQSRGVAFRRVHFLDFRMHQEYLRAKTDRKDPRKRFFRALPDPRYGVWPPDTSTCIAGAPVNGVPPAWDAQCLSPADWAALPHYDKLGPVEGPYDLASMIQHELGHALLGDHTGAAGRCQTLRHADFEDFRRDPVYTDTPIRMLEWDAGGNRRASGYSCLFFGNGIDAAVNIRGVFEADGMRLAGGALDLRCRPVPGWEGFATTYPKARGLILLQKPGGETKHVDDWRYAQRLMEWPVAGGAPGGPGWFQTGFLPGADAEAPATAEP